MAADIFFVSALGTAAFVTYLNVPIDYLAHGFAILSLVALALVIQFKFKLTGTLIWAFTALSTSLVVFDLFPDYSLSEPFLIVVATFGAAAGLFAVGYKYARDAGLESRVVLYETAFLLTLALLVCALIARVASGGRWEFSYMVMGLYASVWGLLAGVQFRRLAQTKNMQFPRKILAYGYSALGLGAFFIALVISPLSQDSIKGIFPADTVMVAYALPTLVIYALFHFKLLPEIINRKMVLGFSSAIAVFIAIQEIRRFWHGAKIHLYRGVEVGELYTYTVILLAATVTTVMLAITRKNPVLRRIGLALAAITAGKVFLFDTAGMQGLARATVFIALGLTLAGIGWVLQVQAANDEKTGEP